MKQSTRMMGQRARVGDGWGQWPRLVREGRAGGGLWAGERAEQCGAVSVVAPPEWQRFPLR